MADELLVRVDRIGVIAAVCLCGTTLASGRAPWGCTECAGDCCSACASWLESTVYCPRCTEDLLAA
jgi:hypothetical protein